MTTSLFSRHVNSPDCISSETATFEEWKEKLAELHGDQLTFRLDPSYELCVECLTSEFNRYVGAFYEDTNQSFIYIYTHEE